MRENVVILITQGDITNVTLVSSLGMLPVGMMRSKLELRSEISFSRLAAGLKKAYNYY